MHTILPQGTKEEQLNLEYIVGDGETTSIKSWKDKITIKVCTMTNIYFDIVN